MTFDNEINILEHRILASDQDSDALRWQQAERVTQLLRDGWKSRAVAALWINLRTQKPYAYSHVNRVAAAVWHREHLSAQGRPTFIEAYRHIKTAGDGGPRHARHLARVERIRELSAKAVPVPDIAADVQMTPKAVRKLMRSKIAKPSPPPLSDDVLAERIRALTLDGHNFSQIVSQLNISRARISRIAAEHKIQLFTQRGAHRIDATRFLEQIVLDAEGLTEHLDLLDLFQLDPVRLPALITRARAARQQFGVFIRQLVKAQERLHETESRNRAHDHRSKEFEGASRGSVGDADPACAGGAAPLRQKAS